MNPSEGPVFSPSDPEFHADPHSVLARMRAVASVARASGKRLVSVFSHHHVEEAFRDWRTYSSVIPQMRELFLGEAEIVIQEDPPQHTEHRRLLSHAFRKTLKSSLALYEAQLRNKIQTVRGAAVDVLRHLASPLATEVAVAMIGLEAQQSAYVEDWTRRLSAASGQEFMDASADAEQRQSRLVGALHAEMTDVLSARLRANRRFPDNSLFGELQRLGRPSRDFIAYGKLLLFASKHTTALQMGNALYLLAKHPEVLTQLRSGSVSVISTVEEILRLMPVFNVMNRRCAVDHEFAGVRIAKGDDVLLWIASANHDETVFSRSSSFDPRREAKTHVAFGAGPHVCLGAGLARAELATLVRVLVGEQVLLQLEREPFRLDDPWVETFEELRILVT